MFPLEDPELPFEFDEPVFPLFPEDPPLVEPLLGLVVAAFGDVAVDEAWAFDELTDWALDAAVLSGDTKSTTFDTAVVTTPTTSSTTVPTPPMRSSTN